MFKKIVVGLLVAAVGLYALNNTRLGRSLKTIAYKFNSKVEEKVDEQISVDDDLQELKKEVANLDPTIKDFRRFAAKDEVAVAGLRSERNALQASVNSQKTEIARLTADLKNAGSTTVAVNGRNVKASELTAQLDDLLNRFEIDEKTLESKERLLTVRERGLQATKDKLFAMNKEKAELERQIALVEAEYREVQLAQTETQSPSAFDNSRLNDIKTTLAKVKTRVQVEKADSALAREMDSATGSKAKSTPDTLRRAEQALKAGGKVEATVVNEDK